MRRAVIFLFNMADREVWLRKSGLDITALQYMIPKADNVREAVQLKLATFGSICSEYVMSVSDAVGNTSYIYCADVSGLTLNFDSIDEWMFSVPVQELLNQGYSIEDYSVLYFVECCYAHLKEVCKSRRYGYVLEILNEDPYVSTELYRTVGEAVDAAKADSGFDTCLQFDIRMYTLMEDSNERA